MSQIMMRSAITDLILELTIEYINMVEMEALQESLE